MGDLPESKHLADKNYADWKFLMKNFFIDVDLWQITESFSKTEMDKRTLARNNLSIKPTAFVKIKKAKAAKKASESL